MNQLRDRSFEGSLEYDMENRPLVSVGMPVFNDAKHLKMAIDSLLEQSYDHFELILSDDCSTDESQGICIEYVNKDRRVRYIRQGKNLGISKNMEFLLKEARGDFFMWAGDDDVWHKEFLSTLLKPLIENEKAALSFCPYIIIDEEGNKIERHGIRKCDYSSPHRLARLVKFCFYYDDGCGYGLFRKKLIRDVEFPVWWGINKTMSLNNIYPPILYFLSVGDFILVGEKELWFKRMKAISTHSGTFSKKKSVRKIYAFFLRKINVLVKSTGAVYKGSRNLLLTISILPALILRLIADCFKQYILRN